MFQKTVVIKYLKTQNRDNLLQKWDMFKEHFHHPEIQSNIRQSKEEQYQGEFLIDLFVNILGYTKNPTPNYNLTTEYKNVKDSKKADGAIVINNSVTAIIELKGTKTTDLSKIEEQAFGYKNNQPDCKYIITSNFEKLRLYIDNAIEHLEFNLFELTFEQFQLLYLCLACENISADIPAKIKIESLSQEDAITKKLYKDYSVFKRELFTNLTVLNPDYEPIELFKKSQKLLDRFLFLFFGEDRGLLPPNSVRLILEDWTAIKDRDEDVQLYDRFKKYFGYLNIGFKGKRYDVFAYNGGLFKTDEILDAIKIDDELLYKHTLKLADYDFDSEVDVNILGHIFENSLNELDEVKAQLEGQEIDKSKTKRKKDGVFYTPKYITKYIVENTVGKLCEDKKIEFAIIEEDYFTDKKRQQKTKAALLKKLDNYRVWLHQITIIDPACGSGAFLNEALNFLIEEHQYIDELEAKLTGSSIAFTYHSESILENNLFGVDLNEESVEIAKLSLWLRTAEPNRKLNSLSDNIKCGNSLIDDPEVAGDKAFDWEQEFPHIFAKGGFDVVIGNPPYVRLESIREVSLVLEKCNYKTYEKRGDLYALFVERGIDILKEKGIISYIMPNKWLQAGYGKPLREFILNYCLTELIDFGDFQIFEGATTYPCIFNIKKDKPKEYLNISVLQQDNKLDFYTEVINTREIFEYKGFNSDTWVISSRKNKELLSKLSSNFKSLSGTITYYNRGIIPGLSEAFIINESKKEELIKEDLNSEKIIGSLLRGRDITRYGYPSKNDLDHIILAGYGSYKYLEKENKGIFNYLSQFEEKLKLRGQCNGSQPTIDKPFYGQHHWLELDNNPTEEYLRQFQQSKIMYQVFQVKPNFIFDEQSLYCNNSMWIIPTKDKGLLAILNSKMGWWLITQYCTQIQNGYQLIWKYFSQIPIAKTTMELGDKADQMLSLNKDLQEVSAKFQRTCERKFGNLNQNKKLQDWYKLSYADFIKELTKQKIKLTLSDEAEWADYFDQEKSKALEIQSKIASTDQEIDQMVYELYELTEEEIKIVENS